MKEKVKEESRRNTYVFQGFLTQNFFFRTSRKIQDLVGGAILYQNIAVLLSFKFRSAILGGGSTERILILCHSFAVFVKYFFTDKAVYLIIFVGYNNSICISYCGSS